MVGILEPPVLSPPPVRLFTEQEYLLRERDAVEKSDFLNGEIIKMPGVSLAHNRINENLSYFFRQQFIDKGCETLSRDIRTRVQLNDKILYTYPDFIVVCGEPQLAPDEFDNLINPMGVVEILSSSTENYDKGVKADLYRSILSLNELVFVNQYKPFVEHYVRKAENRWELFIYQNLKDSFEFCGCPISLEQIYQLVKFK